MQSFDIVIVGSGIVGLALACGLQDCGVRIAIIENSPSKYKLEEQPQRASLFTISVINAASKKLLEYLGVWQSIVQGGVSGYQHMEFWHKDNFGYIKFDAKEYYLNNFGYIIKNSIIRRALWQAAKKSKDITLLTKINLKQIIWGDNEVFIGFDNKEMLTTKLVIGADGAKSWLRIKADIPLSFWDYENKALVAIIRTELPHMYTTRQSFYDDSILAFLPLHDPYLCSIVWSLPAIEAYRLLYLEESIFDKELSIALDMRLGFCKLISERHIFPLKCQYARNFAGQRIALIGDAAHNIHPLVGQGINLGLMDVAELIGQIQNLNATGKDIGQYLYLQSYERKRKYSTILMLISIYGLSHLFNLNNPMKRIICDMLLLLFNKMPGIKPKLLNYALGLHDIPEWLVNITTHSSEMI